MAGSSEAFLLLLTDGPGAEEISARRGVRIATMARAGDGNLHPILVLDADRALDAHVWDTAGEVFAAVPSLGGTLTDVLGMQRGLTALFDPRGILNPGKAISMTALHSELLVDGTRMRQVLGHFASGVVVVTGVDAGGPLGFTCQSFSSLSLDPPLVSLAAARTSSTWPRLRAVGAFCVNVLADGHEHHSVRFARSGVDRFAGVSWTPDPGGAPILDGVAAWVSATLEHEYDGGDHTIVVGRVRALGADPARAPLLFHRGRYGRLAG